MQDITAIINFLQLWMLTTLRLEKNWCQQGMINVSGYSIRKQVEAGKPTILHGIAQLWIWQSLDTRKFTE